MNEFVPQRTSAYISQQDLHIGEMTVRETLSFSARCQGVGPRYGQNIIQVFTYFFPPSRNYNVVIVYGNLWFFLFFFADMLTELSRREKAANIKPDPDLDIIMKVEIQCHFLFSKSNTFLGLACHVLI